MTRVTMLIAAIVIAAAVTHAQAPASTSSGDAAVNALITEVRALRADMAAASRNQLRAQMLLGRVQMQEQRLAYLDKQRSDAANALAQQQQMMASMQLVMPAVTNPCANMPPQTSANDKRECEAGFAARRQQLEALEAREQQLRNQEGELASALQAEQARWSDFNNRLDELERSLR